MKVSPESLWPLLLHFIEEHFGAKDLKAFKKYFDLKIEHESSPLVKAGGMQAILGDYFKRNRAVYLKFKKTLKAGDIESDDEPKVGKRKRTTSGASNDKPKKRKRADSNVSVNSVASRTRK